MGLTREERETILRTSDADDCWIVSTASPRYIRKFTKLDYRQNSTDLMLDSYRDFTIPRNLVTFRRSLKK